MENVPHVISVQIKTQNITSSPLTTISEGNNNNDDADEGEKEKSSDYTFQIPGPLVSTT